MDGWTASPPERVVLYPRHMSAAELRLLFPDALGLAFVGQCSCGAEVVQRWQDGKRNADGSLHVCGLPEPITAAERVIPAEPEQEPVGVADL